VPGQREQVPYGLTEAPWPSLLVYAMLVMSPSPLLSGAFPAMFDVTIAAAFLVFVLSPCVFVLRPGAHHSEDQTFVV
jgi:hypothetical protein